MTSLSLAAQTMFAELVQRCLDAEFDDRYHEQGNFVRRRRGRKLYWYYQRRENLDLREEYVGPVRDAAITERVRHFETIKSDYKERRDMVRALIAARRLRAVLGRLAGDRRKPAADARHPP